MKRVLVTGGSGFLGRKLAEELLARGDQVTVLTRDPGRARRTLPAAVRLAAWTPERDGLGLDGAASASAAPGRAPQAPAPPWLEELGVVDAVVHLAGEPVARRWTDDVKRAIERSRVASTRLLVEAIARSPHKPAVFVCASATGFYGPRPPEEQVDEATARGQGFLADVVARWEEAARAVEAHGVRAVEVRFGVVLGEGGGALEKMVLPFKLHAGGPIGDGTQVVPWVHRDDVVGILLLALDDERVTGPINAVSPYPATSRELAQALGAVLGRSSWLPAPAAALRAAMGEAASILTTGHRVYPTRAVELGYAFRHARLVPALESLLGS